MHNEKNATEILLQALTSNSEDFVKIILEEKPTTNSPEYEIPLEKAFAKHFTAAEDGESLRAIALVATLYLSTMHCGFPTRLLRASVGYLRENISLPTFNCNHYEQLYAKLTDKENVEFTLFTNIDKFTKINLSKTDIFDAFDFLSNGL
jgi:hypothetical protein